ncbi:hypothetical protein MMA91_24715, partial [Salmonella enterica]|nr:hypothetical protein [Salmonella enterica subsp. enterica serovar Weltevreden]MCH5974235.1 hypothetical protein [Salmonella enterica]
VEEVEKSWCIRNTTTMVAVDVAICTRLVQIAVPVDAIAETRRFAESRFWISFCRRSFPKRDTRRANLVRNFDLPTTNRR